MLIEFSVKNYRSFWESQTLSMAAGATKELQEENCFIPSVQELPRLLRSAVVYGPNGGGKSNLIKALGFMKKLVLLSAKESQEGERIALNPFLLHREGSSQASEFEVVFVEDGVRYQYGFAATNNQVTREWLLAYPGNRAQRWFERSYNPKKEKEEWYFGAKFIGQKKTWQKSTRPNALFLSTAVQLNSEQLKPVFNWFQKLVVIGHGERIERGFTVTSCEVKEERNEILTFLKNAGIEVDGIIIKEKNLDDVNFSSGMPDELRNFFQKDLQGRSFKEVFFKHQLTNSEDSALFPLTEESDGTQKLFAYAAPWLDLLTNGRVLVVDELDNSFHPHLVRFLLKLIHGSKSNKANGQLIFSTHDTSILDTKVLRRDQIWFMEKDDTQATQLYPLSDFHPRKHEALEKGYLQGRFGALPYIGEVKF
ncbi:MAG: ATP-binding protein [Proteobacteria bacterium]|nr:ATP-binding protein [Pseudomonadota bacterium]MBU1060900.1 ATP-binding protein [Pseudomonadota bacterium]